MLNSNCIILKDNYDINLLIKDYNIARETEFTKRTYVKGASISLYKNTTGWSSIPLHSLDGEEGNGGNILRFVENDRFKPTNALKKFKYFQKILQDLNTDIYLVRLMKLDVDGYIAPHSDAAQFHNMLRMIRCAMPIITSKKVKFAIDDVEYNLEEGKLWYTDVNKTHWVKNNSNKDRIHLVIDIKPTIEMMDKIGLTQLHFFKKFYFKNNNLENKSIQFKRFNKTIHRKTDICLIMCQWKRYHTFDKIFKQIHEQTMKVDLYLWNNNFEDKDKLIEVLSKYHNSNINIYLYNSPYNIKCIGRIITAYLCRYLYKNIIFFDDDESMDDNLVIETLYKESVKYPNTILSFWAQKIVSTHEFYKRIRGENNELVNYAGGGGCIIPSELFSAEFMNWIPSYFFNVEDFLCNIYIATHMKGYSRASNANISFIEGECNSKDAMSFGIKYCDRTGVEIHKLKDMCLQWSIKNFNYPKFNLSKREPVFKSNNITKKVCNNSNYITKNDTTNNSNYITKNNTTKNNITSNLYENLYGVCYIILSINLFNLIR